VLLTGLARDGGLYVPRDWPTLDAAAIASLAGVPYQEAATRVLAPFVAPDLSVAELAPIVEEAYAGFGHRTIAPLVQIGPSAWLLELFHGPTLAFKDVAMQVLARLMDRALARRGARATIVGATSGDTGGAAVEAFRGRSAIDVFILYPQGRVSEVQRRQMTTPAEANVHAIAIEGTFDDCQAIVKALFNDLELRDRIALAGVNSINWARILAQIVYYVTSAVALGAPGRRIAFSVPTGNFGDIFAGYAASRIGLPIERLIIATNANDILARMHETGRYETRAVVATSSPSMDIQISSNFERLLFELAGRNPARVRSAMKELGETGRFALQTSELEAFRSQFSATSVDEPTTDATIRSVHEATGYLADPHTAVGIAAAEGTVLPRGTPAITLATAHPAKFPEAVERAIGAPPSVPHSVARQLSAKERFTLLPNSADEVARLVSGRTRAGKVST
jgi:threonine synthase